MPTFSFSNTIMIHLAARVHSHKVSNARLVCSESFRCFVHIERCAERIEVLSVSKWRLQVSRPKLKRHRDRTRPKCPSLALKTTTPRTAPPVREGLTVSSAAVPESQTANQTFHRTQ
ncbi:hypothetical protein IQ06DRAFT_61196 [Phaeosphaeriaceae sp. SRC1lsM3a]|nr:hypothetical protein IQ06DRAFT_61196 [Stagonospora sp. SRC1lsM3a]